MEIFGHKATKMCLILDFVIFVNEKFLVQFKNHRSITIGIKVV